MWGWIYYWRIIRYDYRFNFLKSIIFKELEFKRAKQILNKNKDKKFTDEEIIEIMKIMEVFVKLAVNDLFKSSNKKE